jgi:hypothetical protein
MRSLLEALAWPNRNAAAMLMTRPMKVRALGEMRVSARPCTMRSRSQPQARPKALVQVVISGLPCYCSAAGGFAACRLAGFGSFVVNSGQLEDFKLALAVGGDDGGHVAHALADHAAPDGRGG